MRKFLATNTYVVSDDCGRGVDVSQRRAQAWSEHDGSSDADAALAPCAEERTHEVKEELKEWSGEGFFKRMQTSTR